MRNRIVGIGSPLGDDSIGWLLIKRLNHRSDIQADLIAASPVQLTELTQDCDRLILVDAALTDLPRGQIVRLVWPDPRLVAGIGHSTHALSVADALRLADVLGRLPSRVILLGVSAGTTRAISPPDACLIAALGKLESAVVAELERDI